MDVNLVFCLRTNSLSQVSEISKARKEATLVSFGPKEKGRHTDPLLPRGPLHLDIQIELLPEVIMQGRHL